MRYVCAGRTLCQPVPPYHTGPSHTNTHVSLSPAPLPPCANASPCPAPLAALKLNTRIFKHTHAHTLSPAVHPQPGRGGVAPLRLPHLLLLGQVPAGEGGGVRGAAETLLPDQHDERVGVPRPPAGLRGTRSKCVSRVSVQRVSCVSIVRVCVCVCLVCQCSVCVCVCVSACVSVR